MIENYYELILTTHILSVVVTIALVIFSDLYGLRWVLGYKQTLNPMLLKRLHLLVWIGLLVTMLAGALMASVSFSYLITLSAFKLKLLFVLGLNLNAVVISKHLSIATTMPFANVPQQQKTFLIISGLVSGVCWIGALIAAQFLGLS